MQSKKETTTKVRVFVIFIMNKIILFATIRKISHS
jgi:hypothetical protein